MEVVISMFVLLIGLMGVAAMFPVGSHYVVRGEQLNRGAEVGQAAAHDAITRGVLDPRLWVSMNNIQICRGDFYLPLMQAALNLAQPQNHQRPHIAVIDPMGVAMAREQFLLGELTADEARNAATTFPYDATPIVGLAGRQPPLVRLTVQPPSAKPAFVCSRAGMELLFSSNDDVILSIPEESDASGRVLFDPDAQGDPARRQWQGDFSWLATVSPCYQRLPVEPANPRSLTLSVPNTGMDPAHKCTVSVVVFAKRGLQFPLRGTTQFSEREVGAHILSAGVGGGEVRLFAKGNDETSLNKLRGIRQGEWLFLYGRTTEQDPLQRRLFADWYQIISVDAETENAQTERFLTLKGTDWPWQAGTGANGEVRAALLSGAIAVYTQTIRLDQSSLWSAPRSVGHLGLPISN